jgi:hypothetical protein
VFRQIADPGDAPGVARFRSLKLDLVHRRGAEGETIMRWTRVLPVMVLLAALGCGSPAGPGYESEDERPPPGNPDNPKTGSIIVNPGVSWV